MAPYEALRLAAKCAVFDENFNIMQVLRLGCMNATARLETLSRVTEVQETREFGTRLMHALTLHEVGDVEEAFTMMTDLSHRAKNETAQTAFDAAARHMEFEGPLN